MLLNSRLFVPGCVIILTNEKDHREEDGQTSLQGGERGALGSLSLILNLLPTLRS